MTTLKYYGHSCFLLSADNGWKGIFDPYEEGSVDGLKLPEITADAVFCSHGHADHNGAHRINRRDPLSPSPYETMILKTEHDKEGGRLRGMNDIVILKNEQEKIVHCGDLGRLLRADEVPVLKQADVLMIPCGGFYTIDAAEAKAILEAVQSKLTVLMHYRRGASGYAVLASLDDVQKILPETRVLDTDTVDLKTETGVIALTPSPDCLI